MKKKTAVICLSKIDGGMELDSIKIAKLLSTSLHIEFITKKNSFIESRKNVFNQHHITLHSIDFLSNFSFNLIRKTRKILKQRNIKNVIFFGASEMKSLYFATLGLNINFIVMQGTTKSTSKKDFIHKIQYSNVNHFVGNSKHISNNMKRILPISNHSKLHTIYTPVKLKENISFKKTTKQIDIVHVGRITKGKGQLEAIKACEILYKHNIDFTFKLLGSIHNREYFKEINEYLKNCDYKDKIKFIGFTSDISKYLQESDIFLFPTYGEGMSNAIIESMAYGLVPIVYNNTSTPEFKDLGFFIHLTRDDNVKSLQEILLDVSKNIESEKISSQQNHKKALEVFGIDRAKNNYLNLLI